MGRRTPIHGLCVRVELNLSLNINIFPFVSNDGSFPPTNIERWEIRLFLDGGVSIHSFLLMQIKRSANKSGILLEK